jgi:hypothetical protein
MSPYDAQRRRANPYLIVQLSRQIEEAGKSLISRPVASRLGATPAPGLSTIEKLRSQTDSQAPGNAVPALTQEAEPLMLNSSGYFFLSTEGVPVLRVRVFYHDKCFDGACSASLFTRFHRECVAGDASYEYHGLVHRAGALFDENEFTGDQNAIVDFKYSSSPKITWWFDHHLSAFLTPQDQQNFQACQQDPECARRKFFDPNYTSCTSFLAHIAATKFGFDTAPVAELIHWADIVDGAQYESPESAVEMAAPAMKLTLIIESTQDPAFIPRLIPLLTAMPLAEVLSQPFVAELLPPLMERHKEALELIRGRAEQRDGTIFFDITDHPLEGFNKFIPYYLYPNATYSIGLSKSSFRTKVAVGSNPWTKADPAKMVNLAAVCERYGGGGHARVGAISFPPDQADKARAAAAEIVSELRANKPLG